jgi:hypothetical protein
MSNIEQVEQRGATLIRGALGSEAASISAITGVASSLPTNVRWSVAGLEIVANACVVSAAIEARAADTANTRMLRADAFIWTSFKLEIGGGDRSRRDKSHAVNGRPKSLREAV